MIRIGKCVTTGFLTSFLLIGVEILIDIVVSLLSGGVLKLIKVIWYAANFLCYLKKAWSNRSIEIKGNQEKAENYGKSLANFIKAVLTIFSVPIPNKIPKRLFRIKKILSTK
jgi:hypothetical protein